MSSKIDCDDESRTNPAGELVDEMLARYIDWRENAAIVADVHRCWREDRAGDDRQWYATYEAALVREETAATAYELAVWQVEHSLLREVHPKM